VAAIFLFVAIFYLIKYKKDLEKNNKEIDKIETMKINIIIL
jgi:hypothetical protein